MANAVLINHPSAHNIEIICQLINMDELLRRIAALRLLLLERLLLPPIYLLAQPLLLSALQQLLPLLLDRVR